MTGVPDPRRAVFAFDQAVDRLAEEAAFVGAGEDRQAARYLADACSALSESRTAMHELEALASDPGLKKRARRRLHALAVDVAQTGLRDAERVAGTARRLSARLAPIAQIGWGDALRTQTARATAWGVEKWTGSPLARAELRSTRTASEALATRDVIVERGRVPAAHSRRRRLYATGSAIAVTAVGTASLAVYGAWSLIGVLFGLG
ncbi:hypothetical protein N8K70_08220 [Microbacterium betulae]|uniref:Uncharacterized protein n=1 Tax=Microbacterium betulae TaxID=2981139 RepID=A0AA97FMA0_9MICO|nr:hypothetical protein [Microbacterium sp. AB]WOF24624.1 hypothetical protein N8K70_08220 [Microbacterium sp. AB]